MKISLVALVLALAFTGFARGQTLPGARVVRLMVGTNSTNWRIGIDGEEVAVVSSRQLTNKLAKLHLRQGDLVLLGTLPNRKSGPLAETWQWIAGYCDSNRVAVYLYGVYAPAAATELFRIPVYNWTAPYDYPLGLADASFFREGRFLGKAQGGFDNMLRDIERTKPKKLFILGSLYDINRSLGPTPTPYERQRDRLESVLKSTGTDLIELDVEPGF
jgi:hypothetical protein